MYSRHDNSCVCLVNVLSYPIRMHQIITYISPSIILTLSWCMPSGSHQGISGRFRKPKSKSDTRWLSGSETVSTPVWLIRNREKGKFQKSYSLKQNKNQQWSNLHQHWGMSMETMKRNLCFVTKADLLPSFVLHIFRYPRQLTSTIFLLKSSDWRWTIFSARKSVFVAKNIAFWGRLVALSNVSKVAQLLAVFTWKPTSSRTSTFTLTRTASPVSRWRPYFMAMPIMWRVSIVLYQVPHPHSDQTPQLDLASPSLQIVPRLRGISFRGLLVVTSPQVRSLCPGQPLLPRQEGRCQASLSVQDPRHCCLPLAPTSRNSDRCIMMLTSPPMTMLSSQHFVTLTLMDRWHMMLTV